MSVTGSMYAGISGLTTHSQAMSVIGNNLANTSTLGFKAAVTHFEDVFYSTVNTASGLDQVGHGSTVSTIFQDFSQGSYEASSEATHVAIGGNGFFMVENPNTGQTYYTRAGDFTFDQDGYLVDPHGYQVQGWYVNNDATERTGEVQTSGAISDLRLESYQSPPKATTSVSMYLNLDADADDNSQDTVNPYFAMFGQWDGTADDPLGDTMYAYQNTISVYDEAGSPHELTIYFDPVDDAAVASGAGSNQVWEFVVTCSPDDDGRTIDGQTLSTTSGAGLLMTGTMTFTGAGEMLGMTAFTLASSATGDLTDLSNWTPAEFSDNGFPVFTANFSGADNASTTDELDAIDIELDFGYQNNDLTGTGWNGAPANASLMGNDYANLFTFNSGETTSSAVTAYDAASATLDQSQDGYAMGFLQSVSVDRDGVLTGLYSNGQNIDLFVFALADFTNPQGLILDGGNLYLEGSESGEPSTGRANTSRFGSIAANTLEQSNVDVSTEMVRLITTQRGYQANSKVITTADSMLQEALNLKR